MGTRRDFLIGASSLAAGVGLSQVARPLAKESPPDPRPLKVAYLTDMHIAPQPGPERSFANALVKAQSHQPDLIVNGGDAIMDALRHPLPGVKEQWRVFHRVIEQNCSQPILHCLGNHDIFGWANPTPDPKGKLMAQDELGLKQPYYVKDLPGWRLIILDSNGWAPGSPKGYAARLGEEQLLWLDQQLSESAGHVCVISHIPIMGVAPFFDGPNEASGDWMIPGAWMHLDARQIKAVFQKHTPKVKACLSGHIHLVDQVEYAGVQYFCNGAVSGDYWRGPYQEFPPAYALMELHADGRVERQMVTYDWG